MEGVLDLVCLLQVHHHVGDSGEDPGASPRDDATGL